MKLLKSCSLAVLLIVSIAAKSFANGPEEGMWLPLLLKALNESDMRASGLKLTAEDIYSINQASLKDAVVWFGGFCTGEMVSDQGLLFTNHHCGYGNIQDHSTPEKDYLKNGFWAMDRKDELPNEGLTATFIIRIEDVTARIKGVIKDDMDEATRKAAIAKEMAAAEAEAVQGTHYKAQTKPFFYGNEYYMFVMETFRDVRLVGAPPESIGAFGGDTDNWSWPRHNADFSVFRVYAGPDGKPADYSPDNVPFKPRKHFTISMKGTQPGDFTMVYGFPGRTQEYITSYAVDHVINVSNPTNIGLRKIALDIIQADMRSNDTVRIQYAAKEASISNYHKKWSGESTGLIRNNAIERKRELEARFSAWAAGERKRSEIYGNLLPAFKDIYDKMRPWIVCRDYINEAAMRVELVSFASGFTELEKLIIAGDKPDEISKAIETQKARAKDFYKNFNTPTDKKLFAALLQQYYTKADPTLQPDYFLTVKSKYSGDFAAFAEVVYSKSVFRNQAAADAFLKLSPAKMKKALDKDPGYQLAKSVISLFTEKVRPQLTVFQGEIEKNASVYMRGLREMMPEKKFYPDANSTLRVAFGKVSGYEPHDGAKYRHFTTLDGIMEKYVPGDVEFDVPARLRELYQKKDFGDYAVNGTMRVAFTASNHTTGGNSGSPVLNGEGQLIGINFDRVWEGTMSDIMFDPDHCRNISVDVRYVLFIIDKYAGAGHLIKEMTLAR